MSRMSCGIDAGTIRTSQQPWSQTTGVVGAAVCVRWLLRGRADRARVSGYWCSEMMLVVRCGDACVDGEREEEEVVVSCFVCSAGYDAYAALRSVYGSSSSQPNEFRQL